MGLLLLVLACHRQPLHLRRVQPNPEIGVVMPVGDAGRLFASGRGAMLLAPGVAVPADCAGHVRLTRRRLSKVTVEEYPRVVFRYTIEHARVECWPEQGEPALSLNWEPEGLVLQVDVGEEALSLSSTFSYGYVREQGRLGGLDVEVHSLSTLPSSSATVLMAGVTEPRLTQILSGTHERATLPPGQTVRLLLDAPREAPPDLSLFAIASNKEQRWVALSNLIRLAEAPE